MKQFYILLAILIIGYSSNAQIIDIPDANFKNALVNTNCCNTGVIGTTDADVDFNNDGEIQISEALQILTMNVSDESISSLTGIEYFNNLENLYFFNNQIASINLSDLTNLINLSCSNNALTSLDLNGLVNLERLTCINNVLTSLDLNGLVNLENLNCRENQLTSLELNGLVNLQDLNCSNNLLSSIDLTTLTNLMDLYCAYNSLTSLTIPNLAELGSVYCSNNQLTSITVDAAEFNNLNCNNNLLTTLDLSSTISLNDLICNDNLLTSLNLGSIDLNQLNCNYNQLTNLDISSVTNLEYLNCQNNQLTDLNLPSQNDILFELNCSDNNLTSLNVENLNGLDRLYCANNELSSLSVNSDLYIIYAINNQLTSLDLSNSFGLFELYVTDNLITSLDLGNCPILNTIFCENNSLTTIDVSYNPDLCNFHCDNNDFTSIIFGEASNCVPFDVFFDDSPNLSVVCTVENNFGWVQDKLTEYGYTDCTISSYCSLEPYGDFFIVQGQAKIDENDDGCDVNDVSVSNLGFNISSNDFFDTFYANSQGEFELYISSGSHTINPTLENPDYFSISPSSLTVDFPADTSPYLQDFCITPNGTHNDLEITLIPIDEARPGFDASFKLVYKNKGTTVLSGSVDLTFQDDLMDLVSANPIEDTQSLNMLTWNFTDLNPFESREILLTMTINSPMDTPPVNGDDVLVFDATVNSSETDETPNDNSFSLNQTVVNSFDPNDKTCLEGAIISPEMVGDYVHYRIRFENTGTANAINVVVKDNIDRTKFDLSTLVPVDASHDFVARIQDNASDYYVEFIFENIDLPFDDANNDGYVVFKIKTLDTLALNDTFENEAEIYFDFNFPIITDPAQTTISTLSTEDFELAANGIKLFPNPTQHILHLKSRQAIEELVIYDIAGRRIQDITVVGVETTIEIDTKALQAGTYFIEIKTETSEIVKAFIKD